MLLIHHKTVDGIQGIEDEMRVHLRTQGFGFCLCQLLFEIGCKLFFVSFSFIKNPADHAKDNQQ